MTNALGCIEIHLNARKAKQLVQLLNRQELQGGLRRKTSPNRNKAAPQAHEPILLNRLGGAVEKAIVNLGIRRLIHQVGAQAIKRRNCARHEESCDKGSNK